MQIDYHKIECDRFLSISDICRLINTDFIDYYRFLSSIEIIELFRPAQSRRLKNIALVSEKLYRNTF